MPDGLHVVGLSVAQAGTGTGSDAFLANGVQPGTSIHLLLAQKGLFLIGMDEGASKVASLQDDKGKAIADAELGMMPEVSEDGHQLKFMVRGSDLPTPGAKELILKGKLVVTAGSDEQTASAENVELKKGTKLTAGPLAGQISEAKAQDWGGEKRFDVTIQSSKRFDGIKDVAFTGADGKAIEARRSGSGQVGMMGSIMIYTVTYSLKGAPEKVNIKVAYFSKMQKKEFPLDARVSVGLPSPATSPGA